MHGRPTAPGAQPAYPNVGRPDYDAAAWGQTGVPRSQGRPAAAASNPYADPYADPQPQLNSDPYAALRPDGFGYSQPQKAADPYGLAGYTAPQPAPSQPSSFARAPQPAPAPAAGYAPQSDPYGASMGYQPAPAQFGASPAPQSPSYPGATNGYAPAAASPAPYTAGYGAAPQTNGYADWGGQSAAPPQAHGFGQSLSVDARDYGHAGFGVAEAGAHDFAPQQGHWGNDAYAEPSFDPAAAGPAGGYAPAMGAGYGAAPQPQPHSSLDQSYAEDEGAYEEEPRRRGSWKKVVGLVACTVLIGGVLSVAYTSIMGSDTGEPTPVIKNAKGPSKVKPSDPGGKQFAHADSKIMGRLGEGGADPAAGEDVSGVRKVPVVVVGRDGSIQPPPAGSDSAAAPPSPTSTSASGPEEPTRAVVAVPGLTVIDGLGGGPSPNRPVGPKPEKAAATPPVQMVTAASPERSVVVSPPVKPVKVTEKVAAKTEKISKPLADTEETSALQAPPKKQKVASLDPAPAAAVTAQPKATGAGYVAVLASVPASSSSRMDALKQFADMQQKYGTILSNKTPDIQEANLGEKGTYHRLLVGPPGSRDSASSVCTQLKAQGYAGCWVTAY